MTAIALTIAGSDSGGGAGIQADLKTFSACAVYGASVIAALTAQNTVAVTGVMDVPPEFVTAQMDAVFSDLKIDAVKIGMLSRPETIMAVADSLKRHGAKNIVLDPVMVAKSGDALLQEDAVDCLRDELLPLADVITPNLPEAAALIDDDAPEYMEELEACARGLALLGPKTVLLKGGHLKGDESPDVLFDGDTFTLFEAERIETRNTHGTGCTLSSAIAAELAKGRPLAEAVAAAKAYITAAIRAADGLDVGKGHGPVHHFHAFWPGA